MAAIPLTRPLMGGRRSPGDSCPHPTSRRDQRTLSRIVSSRAAQVNLFSIAYDGALRIDVRQLSKMSLGIACSPETHAGFSMSRTMLPASTAMIREQNAARKPTGAGARSSTSVAILRGVSQIRGVLMARSDRSSGKMWPRQITQSLRGSNVGPYSSRGMR